jgi:hypothetical protein
MMDRRDFLKAAVALPLLPAPVANATIADAVPVPLASVLKAEVPRKWACFELGANNTWWGFDSLTKKWIKMEWDEKPSSGVRRVDVLPDVTECGKDSKERLPEHLRDYYKFHRVVPCDYKFNGVGLQLHIRSTMYP